MHRKGIETLIPDIYKELNEKVIDQIKTIEDFNKLDGFKTLDISNINLEEFAKIFFSMFGHDNKLKILPFSFYRDIDETILKILCSKQGIYFIPTTEFIEWCKDEIGDKTAIEIGSGVGVTAKALGIKATDVMQMNRPEIKMYYELIGHTPTQYGENVEEIEAIDAIKKYKPDITLATWVTQKEDYNPSINVNEKEILKYSDYLLVGHRNVHKNKDILVLTHKVYDLPFLVSRAGIKNNFVRRWKKRG